MKPERTKDPADLLVFNASKVLTLAGPDRPRSGEEMQDLGAIPGGAVAMRGGRILETGASAQLRDHYADAKRLDAAGGLVMPGFVDCHTHLVYAGSRENELAQRLAGASYLDILAAGGGIHSTVHATRAASYEELTQLALKRMNQMLQHGTTTVEIKSGYGLDLETEKKILEVAAAAGRRHPLDVVPTFLGAHAVPRGTNRARYVNWLIKEALPALRGLSEFCDVFCEKEAFTAKETGRILRAAKRHGYGLKVHAGQFSDLGAAGVAAGLGAVSAEHLENVSEAQLKQMRNSGTVAVLLPGVPFFLLSERYADARRMIRLGVPVALGTDFNPGSCPSFSMQMGVALACLKMMMTVEEAITASTINAAWAIRRADWLGSLEPGKQGDLIVLDVQDISSLPCHFGTNLVRSVVKAGQIVLPPRH